MPIKLIKYLLFMFIVLSCKKESAWDCLKSNGNDVTVNRDVVAFKKIQLFDKVFVNIKQGTEYKVEVTAGKHLLNNIKTEVENNVLVIRNLNKCNFVRGYKEKIIVDVTVPHIDTTDNRGVGDIVFDKDFNQQTIAVFAQNVGDTYLKGTFGKVTSGSHGAGDIYVNGTTDTLFVYANGTNFFYGKDLTVNRMVFVESYSVGDCFVYAPESGTLAFNIHRSGNVYYSGDPSIINNYSDGFEKGKLIKK